MNFSLRANAIELHDAGKQPRYACTTRLGIAGFVRLGKPAKLVRESETACTAFVRAAWDAWSSFGVSSTSPRMNEDAAEALALRRMMEATNYLMEAVCRP